MGEAYEVLKDPEKRAAYDALGRRPQGQDFRPPPDWDAGFEFSGRGFSQAEAADFSDFFATCAELGGAPLPEGGRLDSHSFAGQIKGRPGTPREASPRDLQAPDRRPFHAILDHVHADPVAIRDRNRPVGADRDRPNHAA